MAKQGVVTVAAAVAAELAEYGRRKPGLERSPLAAAALALAADMDDPATGSTSRSMVAKELRDTLAALRALAPAEEAKDDLDELAERRAARRAAS